MVLTIGMFAAAWLVVTLLVENLASSRRNLPKVCHSEQCRRYALRLSESLNTSLDPCVGFTRFVCDGWHRRQRLSVRQEAFLAELPRVSRMLRSMHVQSRRQSPLQRAAAFYRSCEALHDANVDQLEEVGEPLVALQRGRAYVR